MELPSFGFGRFIRSGEYRQAVKVPSKRDMGSVCGLLPPTLFKIIAGMTERPHPATTGLGSFASTLDPVILHDLPCPGFCSAAIMPLLTAETAVPRGGTGQAC